MTGPDATAQPEVVEFLGRTLAIYDLSDTLSNATREVEPNPHEIEYLDHRSTVPIGEQVFGLGATHWRDGLAWAYERVTLTTHSGTHVDAPWHYGPVGPDGERSMTIDQVPLKWCFGPGVVLDVTHVEREAGATENDVRDALAAAGHELRPLDVVLIRTDASRHFGEPNYHHRGVGLRRSATAWLVEQGVRLIGIDAWGLDRPFDVMAAEALNGDTDQLWESHYHGIEHPYLQIERLTNLSSLPRPTGFFVVALPFKLEAGSASWTRVVAVYDVTSS
jgi:kynurenine formamidase